MDRLSGEVIRGLLFNKPPIKFKRIHYCWLQNDYIIMHVLITLGECFIDKYLELLNCDNVSVLNNLAKFCIKYFELRKETLK